MVFVVLALFSSLFVAQTYGNSQFLLADAKELLRFKSSVIDERGSLISWNKENFSSVCGWRGVICRRRSTGVRVVKLEIGNLYLAGNISASKLSIPTLENLNFSNNSFSGYSIPSFILKLTRLKELSLQRNKFSGVLSTKTFEKLPKSLYILNLSKNYYSGLIPSQISLLSALKYLDLSSNNHSGPIPLSVCNITGLVALSLADNELSGEIPPILSALSSLKRLNLSGNALSGSIPPSLSTLTNLTSIDLSGNMLSGEISSGFSKYNSSSFEDNSNLCGPPLTSSCPSSIQQANVNTAGTKAESSTTDTLLLVGVIVLVFVLLAVLIGAATLLYSGYKKRTDVEAEEGKKVLQASFSLSGHGRLLLYQRLDFIFGIEDIVDATENFDEKHLVGAGSFGAVYRASLAGGNLKLAVKRLTRDSSLDERKFQTQISELSQVEHPCLVAIIGCFSDPLSGERLVLYKLYSGGNLWTAIRNKMEWNKRLGAALATAKAIRALHEQDPPMIHGDLKPENVLLDSDNHAIVTDYGVAQFLKMKVNPHLSARPSGSAGYLAPEYVAKRKLSVKTDIFAFGVVLLQMVTGRSPNDPIVKSAGLPQWAMTNSFTAVIDPSLDWLGDYKEVILAVLRLGILCTAKNPDGRPSMVDVEGTISKLADFSFRIAKEVREEESITV